METQAQYRGTSDSRPELGRCFAGDSGMAVSSVLLSAVPMLCAPKLCFQWEDPVLQEQSKRPNYYLWEWYFLGQCY